MEIYHFAAGQPMRQLEGLDAMPAEGTVWLDFERPEAAGWEGWPLRLLGIEIDAEHVSDVANAEHPSFFDGTEAYDLMVFEGLGVRDEPVPLETRVAALVLFDRLLITVRSPESRSFAEVKRRLNANCGKAGTSILWLSHLLLDTMVDRYLGIRAPLMEHFHGLQERLLNLRRSEVDWRGLMSARRVARQLESLSEAQIEALDTWRRRSRFEWKKGAEVRLRDLTEHVGRVRNSARALERDLDAAVQLRLRR
jgi:Mg2+ and Co2+ transporters